MTDTFLLTAGPVMGAAIGSVLSVFMSAAKINRLRGERDDARALSEYYAHLHSDLKAKALIRGSDGRIRKA